ncbi:MAG: BglB-like protein, partial [Bacteroidota bacterium]
MQKSFLLLLLLAALSASVGLTANPTLPTAAGEYRLVIEGFDWGPGVSKVILTLDEAPPADPPAQDFKVLVEKSSDLGDIPAFMAQGEREVLQAYRSDANGRRLETGTHLTLTLAIAPFRPLGLPIHYLNGRNSWVDYRMVVTQASTQLVWDREAGRTSPLLDKFDLSGRFRHGDISLTYAAFRPENRPGRAPLIIWLHGGGEGGTDPSIPVIANKAVHYASDEIQTLFEGAHVLVPQAPTFWMNSVEGGYTTGASEDIYHEALMALIRQYVDSHPDVDPARIYVGGCSNGGYMSLKLILQHPDYFAAAFISALAYQDRHITDEQIRRIRHVPIWFVHSKDDRVTKPGETVVPLYHRLKAVDAPNVHFSFYDHVVDLTGQYGGTDFHYDGHWSW